MAPRMGPMSPVRAYFLWAGLCAEKLAKTKTKKRCRKACTGLGLPLCVTSYTFSISLGFVKINSMTARL